MTAAQPNPAAEASTAETERPVASLNYEQARAELVDTVCKLETGAASLEESLTLWERGEALADRCEEILAGAAERIGATTNGTPTTNGNPTSGDVSPTAHQDASSSDEEASL